MADPDRRFKNSWKRIERAKDHLTAFNSEWEGIFADRSITVVARYDENSGWFVASTSVPASTKERIDRNNLALEIGEYAYQLRACLDGLIWDAITIQQGGSEPSSNTNRVEFPVVIEGVTGKFKDCGFLKFPFPDQLKEWLKSIQPSTTVEPADHPDTRLGAALTDIHNLARFDRHRRLRIVAAVPTKLLWGIASHLKARIVAREYIDTFDLFAGQYEFLRFKFETVDGTQIREMTLKTEVTIEVLLEDVKPFPEMDAGSQLASYIDAIQYIVSRFEETFQ